MKKAKTRQKEKAKNERRETRAFIYLLRPRRSKLRTAQKRQSLSRPPLLRLCYVAPPLQIEPASLGFDLVGQTFFSSILAATPACPASPKGPCAAPSQAPSVAARRRRYNTLDLAGKIVCQGRLCPLWIPPPRNHPVSLDASPQRKNSMRAVMLILRFLCQRERRPL